MVVGRGYEPSYPNWQRKRIQNPSSVSSNLTEGTQSQHRRMRVEQLDCAKLHPMLPVFGGLVLLDSGFGTFDYAGPAPATRHAAAPNARLTRPRMRFCRALCSGPMPGHPCGRAVVALDVGERTLIHAGDAVFDARSYAATSPAGRPLMASAPPYPVTSLPQCG